MSAGAGALRARKPSRLGLGFFVPVHYLTPPNWAGRNTSLTRWGWTNNHTYMHTEKSIPAKQYDATYWGESEGAQPNPALIRGKLYVISASEQHGRIAIMPISRVDLENDQIVLHSNLGIPLRLYDTVEALTQDWQLAEGPHDWAALRDNSTATNSGA